MTLPVRLTNIGDWRFVNIKAEYVTHVPTSGSSLYFALRFGGPLRGVFGPAIVSERGGGEWRTASKQRNT